MTWLPLTLGILAFAVLMTISIKDLLLIMFRKGFEAGYLRGRKDADAWWQRAELDADKARQQIWREEGNQPR